MKKLNEKNVPFLVVQVFHCLLYEDLSLATYESKGVQKVTWYIISANESSWLYSLTVGSLVYIDEVTLHLGPVRLPIGWYPLYSLFLTCMSTQLCFHPTDM